MALAKVWTEHLARVFKIELVELVEELLAVLLITVEVEALGSLDCVVDQPLPGCLILVSLVKEETDVIFQLGLRLGLWVVIDDAEAYRELVWRQGVSMGRLRVDLLVGDLRARLEIIREDELD